MIANIMLSIKYWSDYLHQFACYIILQDNVYRNKWKKFYSDVCQVFCLESVLYRTINLKGSSP